MTTALHSHRRNRRDESGASAVEYGLLATAVAAVIAVVVFALGGVVTDLFGHSCDVIEAQAKAGGACTR